LFGYAIAMLENIAYYCEFDCFSTFIQRFEIKYIIMGTSIIYRCLWPLLCFSNFYFSLGTMVLFLLPHSTCKQPQLYTLC